MVAVSIGYIQGIALARTVPCLRIKHCIKDEQTKIVCVLNLLVNNFGIMHAIDIYKRFV